MASRSALNFPARLLYSLCTRSVGPEERHDCPERPGRRDCMITADRKVSPQEAADKENAKRPAITGLLDASLASRFLSDPIITNKCDQLAKDEFVVQRAQQLLEALQASTVLEDGAFNDSAFEHFALVMRIWRNELFNSGIQGLLVQDCVVPDIIEKLSNEVENEQIGERMCRIKADHNLSDILQLKRPPATMIRGLLIILLGYWSYKKLPLPLGFDEKLMYDGALFSAKLHCDLAHEVLEDPHFIQLLSESIKMDFDGRRFVEKYGKRAKVGNEDVLATVKNIIKDPGFHQYMEQIEKNEVCAAVRFSLSILIVHWMYDDVHEKVLVKLDEYAQAELDAKAEAWKATGYDNVEAKICYVTRFAGDLKGLNEALVKVYGNRSYKHVFDEIKIVQFHGEAITRMDQFDVTMEMKPHLYKGVCEYCSPRIHELHA
ncbi:ankyrin repeat-containing protein 2 [Striga asiatica]|uniref:Ankyrin repeat-containing protein 2 n=1 Tax=Striga asiatica TaxID=4170 RepID=A0A5A7QVH9_STRAF|nr:ankyrin repeat-containing protein 2 [Striga asiatica]